MQRRYKIKGIIITLLILILLAIICILDLKKGYNLLLLCFAGISILSSIVLLIMLIERVKANKLGTRVKSKKVYATVFIIIFFLGCIAGNIYDLSLKRNIIKNGINLDATIRNVEEDFKYDVGKYSRRLTSSDYDIYIEYTIEGKQYKNFLNDYGANHASGETVNIYCDKDDYTNITTEHEAQKRLVFIIVFIVFLIIFFSIIGMPLIESTIKESDS